MTISVIKTVDIARPAAESYDFVADPGTMPRWAIHTVKAIRKHESGRFVMTLPKPGNRPEAAFETGMLADDELAALKACLAGEAR